MLSHYPRPDRVLLYVISLSPSWPSLALCYLTIPVLTESCFMLSRYPRPDRVLRYNISLSPS